GDGGDPGQGRRHPQRVVHRLPAADDPRHAPRPHGHPGAWRSQLALRAQGRGRAAHHLLGPCDRRGDPRGHRAQGVARARPTPRPGAVVDSLALRAGLLVTGTGEEIEGGWLLARDGLIVEVGAQAPAGADPIVEAPNCVAMPGLVNAHDHHYQWATRGYQPDGTLFEWLQALYPVWARIDADVVRAASRAA